MNIFILEDEDGIRKELSSIFTKFNYNVYQFSNIKDSINYLENTFIDISVYILDISLPDGNGFDVLKKIKKHRLYEDHHIIMISGSYEIETIKEAYMNGCDDFVKKPFNVEEMLLKIKRTNNEKIAEIKLKNGLSYNPLNKELILNQKIIDLTYKESLLLDMLFQRIPYVISHEMIEDYIYDGQSIKPEAVRSLVKRLRKKNLKDVILNKVNIGYYIPENLVY